MRSNPAHQLFFIFQLEKILRSNLNFSTSYGRFTDLKSILGLLLVSFIWLGEKNFTKIFTYRRGLRNIIILVIPFMTKMYSANPAYFTLIRI